MTDKAPEALDIPMTPCDSSLVVAEHGYDAATSTLALRFRPSQSLFHYPNFPADLYQKFIAAPSMGQFFNENIRKLNGIRQFPPKPDPEAA